jgi:hypothetical protein
MPEHVINDIKSQKGYIPIHSFKSILLKHAVHFPGVRKNNVYQRPAGSGRIVYSG